MMIYHKVYWELFDPNCCGEEEEKEKEKVKERENEKEKEKEQKDEEAEQQEKEKEEIAKEKTKRTTSRAKGRKWIKRNMEEGAKVGVGKRRRMNQEKMGNKS